MSTAPVLIIGVVQKLICSAEAAAFVACFQAVSLLQFLIRANFPFDHRLVDIYPDLDSGGCATAALCDLKQC